MRQKCAEHLFGGEHLLDDTDFSIANFSTLVVATGFALEIAQISFSSQKWLGKAFLRRKPLEIAIARALPDALSAPVPQLCSEGGLCRQNKAREFSKEWWEVWFATSSSSEQVPKSFRGVG